MPQNPAGGSPGLGREYRTGFLAALALYTLWCLLYIYRTSFVVDGQRVFCLWDDAMVSMRYARNLATGGGFVWNAGGERVQGYTNLGVALIMAAIHRLPIDRTKTSLVVQLVNLGVLLYLIVQVRAITRQLFDSELAGDAAAYAAMMCAPLAVLALQGTDVVIVAAVIVAALRMVVDETRLGGRWPIGVYAVLALGVLVRLDFALVCGVFVAGAFWFPRRPWSQVIGLLVLVAVAASILGWQYAYYGSALPNTFYLKLTGMPLARVLQAGLLSESDFLLHSLVLLAGALAALVSFQGADRRLWLIGVLILVLFGYNVACGGDWIEGYTSRMFAPALPLLVIVVVGAGARTMQRLGVERYRMGFAMLAVLAGASLGTSMASTDWYWPGTTMFRVENREHVRLARYLALHTSLDCTVAMHWAGITPYFLDRTTIDVLGKTDAHIAGLTVQGFSPGHAKWDWDYIVRDRHPDIVEAVSEELDEREDFRAQYVRVDGAGGIQFFARADAGRKLIGAGVTSPVKR